MGVRWAPSSTTAATTRKGRQVPATGICRIKLYTLLPAREPDWPPVTPSTHQAVLWLLSRLLLPCHMPAANSGCVDCLASSGRLHMKMLMTSLLRCLQPTATTEGCSLWASTRVAGNYLYPSQSAVHVYDPELLRFCNMAAASCDNTLTPISFGPSLWYVLPFLFRVGC